MENLSRNLKSNTYGSTIQLKRQNSDLNSNAKNILDLTYKLMNGNHPTVTIGKLEKKQKSEDRHQIELLKIYKTTAVEEEYLKKVNLNFMSS